MSKNKRKTDISRVLPIVERADTDWYETLSVKAKAPIQRGIDDAENRRFVPYSEIKRKIDRLLNR